MTQLKAPFDEMVDCRCLDHVVELEHSLNNCPNTQLFQLQSFVRGNFWTSIVVAEGLKYRQMRSTCSKLRVMLKALSRLRRTDGKNELDVVKAWCDGIQNIFSSSQKRVDAET